MTARRLTPWVRMYATVLVSIALASCGSGSGEQSVNAPAEDVAGAQMQLVFSDHFEPTGGAGRPLADSDAE